MDEPEGHFTQALEANWSENSDGAQSVQADDAFVSLYIPATRPIQSLMCRLAQKARLFGRRAWYTALAFRLLCASKSLLESKTRLAFLTVHVQWIIRVQRFTCQA